MQLTGYRKSFSMSLASGHLITTYNEKDELTGIEISRTHTQISIPKIYFSDLLKVLDEHRGQFP